MRRETYIEEIKNDFPKTNENIEEIIAQFKKEHSHKINLKLEPYINAVLTSSKIKDEDKDLIFNDIETHINIYYYMEKDIFLKLFSYIAGTNMLKNLKQLKKEINENNLPQTLKITPVKNTEEVLTKDLKILYNIRYNNLLLRYIDYLINLFKTD
jgi:hypothetical protein